MRVKHLLALTFKLASLVSSNEANLQPSRGDVLGDDVSQRGGGIALFLQESNDLEAQEVAHTYHNVFTATETRRRHAAPPMPTKKRRALRAEQVFADFSTALQRTFALELATHDLHGPNSSTPSCFALSRVVFSLGWRSSRCISIIPRDSNAHEDNALFPVLQQRRPITLNKPDSPRRKVQMMFFPRPSWALFGYMMKGSPDLSLARRVERRLHPPSANPNAFSAFARYSILQSSQSSCLPLKSLSSTFNATAASRGLCCCCC